MSDEVLSGLKILVALAKADGVVHENERLAIENALEGLTLPEETTIEGLLAADVDLDAELAMIKNPRVKQQTFDSACAIVYVDGEANQVERSMLDKVRSVFELGDQAAASLRFKQALERAFAPLSADTDQSSRRSFAIDDEIKRFAVLGAALASQSLPSFCTSINLTNEVRLARKIGSFYGHRGDAQFWKTFVNNIVGAAGSWLAVSALAKLSAFGAGSRAANAFASAHALGVVTKTYFEKNEAVSTEELRAAFKEAKKQGQAQAKELRERIEAKKAEIEALRKTLDADLLNKHIGEAEYEQKLVSLD